MQFTMTGKTGDTHVGKTGENIQKKEKCQRPAVADFPWGGKIIKCCVGHLGVMSVLNKAIGGTSQPRQIEAPRKCEMNDDLEVYEQ